jgi:hypothetical protein
MKAISLALLFAAAVALTTADRAMAQSRMLPWLQADEAAYPPPPGEPQAGTHQEWIYTYDHHANYLGHWVAVRNN